MSLENQFQSEVKKRTQRDKAREITKHWFESLGEDERWDFVFGTVNLTTKFRLLFHVHAWLLAFLVALEIVLRFF